MYPSVFFVLFVFQYASASIQQKPIKEVLPDSAATGYASWLESIFGLGSSPTDGPEEVVTPVDLKSCKPCECGLARKTRIVGGNIVKYVNEYPWVAQLYYKKKFYCGGSLINSKYILTAAHCVNHFDKKNIMVRLLEHDTKNKTESTIIERNVSKIIMHKGYSAQNFNNDIALIRLGEDVSLNNRNSLSPSPVCLPYEGKTFAGQDGIVIGWGTVGSGGAASSILREVTVPIMSNEDCKKTGYGEKRITANMMCAGLPQGGKDSCQGDSGGPMHIKDGNTHRVVGVVSWGEGCAEKNYPGVYSRVNRYLNWIQNQTADACPCPYGTQQ